MIFYSELEPKKVKTATSKQLGILPKYQGDCNSARVGIKTASSATIIVFLVYNVIWSDSSAIRDGLYCGVTCSVCGIVMDLLIQFYQVVVFYSPRQT